MIDQAEDEVAIVDRIWADDAFDRRSEAAALISYVESLAAAPTLREDRASYSIAVDGGYGEGKSFFLRRLELPLKLRHPVAFIDAWADDLADEPLTALAATLKDALEPAIASSSETQSRWTDLMKKAGAIGKIVAKGLAIRGLELLITASLAEAAAKESTQLGEQFKKALDDAAKDSGKELVKGAQGALSGSAAKGLMEAEIAAFRHGRAAVQELKDSLRALAQSLGRGSLVEPIIIIVDELDRCRPTYAIKLLEEVKHIFDVPGVIFIFGLHSGQLAKSVSAAYGNGFNAGAYLRRFISRSYSLKRPKLRLLTLGIFNKTKLDLGRLKMMLVLKPGNRVEELPVAEIIAEYVQVFGVSARDVFAVVHGIQVALALTKPNNLIGNLLVPMIIGHSMGVPLGEIPSHEQSELQFVLSQDSYRNSVDAQSAHNLMWSLVELVKMREDDLYRMQSPLSLFTVGFFRSSDGNVLAHPSRYGDLLETVGRFHLL